MSIPACIHSFQQLGLEQQRLAIHLMDQSLRERENIEGAIACGEAAVKNLLLQNQIDPSALHNRLIGWACQEGHRQIAKKLLADSRVDPADNQNAALTNALAYSRDQMIPLLLQHPKVDPTGTRASLWAQEKGLEAVRLLLTNPNYVPDQTLFDWACSNKHLAVLTQILDNPKVTLQDKGIHALQQACRTNQHQIVQLLVKSPKVDMQAFGNGALVLAAITESEECVKVLLPLVDPRANDLEALRFAGSVAITNLLLTDERIDPSANDNRVIRMAHMRGKNDVVARLLQDPRVNPQGHKTYDTWVQSQTALTQDEKKAET